MSSSNLFRPVETKRASEGIYEQVKMKIVSGELKPGDRLPSERNMMEIFQRSRPTIREALRMLERSGYIRTVPGSNGAIVTLPDARNMEESMEDALQIGQVSLGEMSEYRLISEVATVDWAAQRATEEDIAAMAACLEEMAQAVDDYEHFIDLDPKFHGLIAAAAKNKVCDVVNKTIGKSNRSFMKQKMQSMTPLGRKKMCNKIHKMHVDMFEAIRNHDSETAKEVMVLHLTSFGSDLK